MTASFEIESTYVIRQFGAAASPTHVCSVTYTYKGFNFVEYNAALLLLLLLLYYYCCYYFELMH
jgi:hypothetical protein